MTFTYSKHNIYVGIVDDEGMEGIVNGTPHDLSYAVMRAACNRQRGAQAYFLKNITKEEFDAIQNLIKLKAWRAAKKFLESLAGYVEYDGKSQSIGEAMQFLVRGKKRK